MKILQLFLLTLLVTSATNAQTMSAYLDFSNLYGKTNAGRYFVGVAVNSPQSAYPQITQGLAEPQSDQPGSEPKVCLTEIRVNAGKVSVILTDADKDKSTTIEQDMILYYSHWDDSEKCTPYADIVAKPLNFTSYFNLGGTELAYPAPRGYSKIIAAMSVFPYGYSVTLRIIENPDGGAYIVKNLKSDLASQLRRGNKEGLYYYVYAEDENLGSLALGSGNLELK